MEIKKVDGWVVRVPEKSYQNKFTDKVKRIGDILLNRRRQDAGTRGNMSGLHHQDKEITSEYKKEKEETFAREDLTGFKEEKDTEERESLRSQILEMKNQEGMEEKQYLEKQQNSEGTIKIDDTTLFSNGTKADGSYLDSNDLEPTIEELKAIEEEEKKEKKRVKDEIDFYSDRGSMGERGKGHRLC